MLLHVHLCFLKHKAVDAARHLRVSAYEPGTALYREKANPKLAMTIERIVEYAFRDALLQHPYSSQNIRFMVSLVHSEQRQ
jgi:hypothetical protein